MSDQLHLEDFVPYQLSRLSNTISAGIAATYRERFDLSITEWRIIAILGRYTDISANEVAHKGALDKVAVSRAVKRLLERDVLTRHIASDDRRRSVLALTPSGQRVYQTVAPAAIALEQRLLDALSPEERTQLRAVIAKLSQQAELILHEQSG